MNRKIKGLFLCLALLGQEGALKAASFTWEGGQSPQPTFMNQGSNWSGGSAPTSGSQLIFPANATGFTVNQNIASPFNLSQAVGFSSNPSIIIDSVTGNPYTFSGSGFAVQASSQGWISIGGGPSVPANTFSCAISVPSTGTLFIGGNNNDIFSGVISGQGNVAIGAGGVVLNAANIYSGTTTLSGPVTIGVTNAIPTASVLSMSSSFGVGTLTLNASQSITINSNIAVGSEVTIGANTLTVTNTASSTTWAGPIVGGFASTGTGSGGTVTLSAGSTGNTLNLSNGNTYSVKTTSASFIGNTIVSGGTLQAGSLSAFGTNSNLSVASGATLDLSPLVAINPTYTMSFSQVSGAGALNLGTSTKVPTVFVYTGGVSFSGTITGNAGITYADTTTWTVPNLSSSSYTGPITISGGGTFSINGLSTATPLSSISVQTTAGATIQADTQGFTANNPITFATSGVIDTHGFNVTLGGVIQGGGGIQKNGSGTLTLSGTNVYSGPTTVAAGTLSVSNSHATLLNSAVSQLVLSGGSLTTPSGANTFMVGYVSGTGGTLNLGSNALRVTVGDGPLPAQTTFAGQLVGSGALSLAGTWTTSTSTALNTTIFNSYTGPLTIGVSGVGNGVLTASSLGTIPQLNFGPASGTLHMTQSFAFTGPVSISSASATTAIFQADSGVTLTLSGAITGTSTSTLETTGSGTVVLNAANTGFSGAVNVSGSTLQLNNVSGLGSASQVTVGSSGILNLNNNSISLSQLLGLVNPPSGAQVQLGTGTLTITAGSSVFPFYGTISGTGGNVVLNGAGTSPTFIGTNTYTGTTTIEGGTFFNTQSLGASSSYIFSGGASGGGMLTIGSTCSSSATLSIASATPATISTNTYNLTLSGNISSTDSTASLIQNGRGTVFLSGTNTGFTGTLVIQGGIVNVGSVAALGNPTTILTQQFAGTLQMNANNLTITPNWVVATTGIFDTNGFNAIYSGSITAQTYANLNRALGGSQFAGFNITGGGTLTLTGTNIYYGPTTIVNGTLVANPTSLPTTVTPFTPNAQPPQTQILVFNAPSGSSAAFTASTTFTTFPQMIFFSSGTINTGTNTITANNIISGASTSTITKAGATGILILSGSNIYTGPTVVSAGTLRAGIASTSTYGAFGINSAVTVSSGATLALNGFSNAIGTLAGSGNVTLGAGTLTINNPNSSSLAFSGPITDSGAGGGLTLSQGTLALTGANNYTGTTTVFQGATLSLNNNTDTVGAVINDGTLIPILPIAVSSYTQASSGTIDLSNILTFPGSGAVNGSGAAALAGTLILPRQKPVSNAVLLQHSTASGTFSTVTNLPNGTSITYGATQTIWNVGGSLACTGIWVNTSAGNWGLTSNWNPSTCAPGVGNDSGTYDDQATFQNLPGHATLTVTMANSAGNAAQNVTLGLLSLGDTAGGTTQYTIQAYQGGTTGVITMGGPSAPEIYVYQGTHTIQAPLAISANTTVLSQTSDGVLVVSGAVALGSNTLTMQNTFASPTGTITFSGAVQGTGGLSVAGGTVALTGSNGFTGGVSLSSGTLQANAAAALSSPLTFTAAATLKATGTLSAVPAITLTGPATIDTNGNAINASGIISGGGSLTKVGAGILTLSGSNTYTGATTVSVGTLQAGISSTTTFGAFGLGSAVTVSSGATLALTAFSNTVGSLLGAGSINLSAATLTISSGAGNTFSGQISGSGGGITLVSGTQTFSHANTYTGTTTISGGTLQAGVVTTAFGTSSPIVLSGSGVLNLNNLSNTVGSLSSTSTASSVVLGSGTLTINAPSGQTFQGVISGTGGVTLNGAGVQTLAGPNTYTGATAITQGTLQAAFSSTFSGATQTSGAFGVGSTVSVSSGATLSLSANNQTTIASLSGSGTGSINLGSGSVLTIANGNSQNFSGLISGNGGLTLSSGTLTLSGSSNTYQGPTIVSAGTLLAGSAGGLSANSAVTVASGATLNFQSNAVSTGALINNGTVLAATTVTPASYTQGDDATLTLTVTAPGVAPYGKITSPGLLTLGGTLSITTGGSITNNIVLLQGAARSGRFATPPAGYALQYSSKSVSPATVSLITSSCTGDWISSASSGNWGVSGNWGGGCIPGIPAGSSTFDVATMSTVAQSDVAVVLTDGSAAITPLLLQLIFNTSDTSFTIQPYAGAGGGSYLQFELSSGTPTIDVLAGAHTINANMQGHSSSVNANLTVASGAQLTLGSSCTISNLATLTITDEGGAGTLINTGYVLPGALVIEGGTIDNAGWMVTSTGNLTIQSTADVTNTGLLSSFASFSMVGGTLSNEAFILSDTVSITGGVLSNTSTGDLSTNSIAMSAGVLTNAGLITTDPFTFSGGTLTNSSLITTTSFVETGSPQMNVQVLNASSFGGITANNVTLAGALSVEALSGFSLPSEATLDLIASSSTITSKFSSVTFQNFPGSVVPSLVYAPKEVQLSIVPVAPSSTGSLATAAQFTSVGQHNMMLLRKGLQLKNRFPGEVPNDISMGDLFVEADFTEFELAEISPVERRDQLLSQRAVERPVTLPWSVYGGPVASFGNVYSKGGTPGAGYYSVGALGGFDYVLTDKEARPCYLGLGAALEYRYRAGNVKQDAGSFSAQKLHGTIYSTIVPKSVTPLAINVLGGFAYEWNDLRRSTGPGSELTAVGKPGEKAFDVLLDLEYTLSKKHYPSLPAKWAFIPLVDLQYIYVHVDNYTESGAGIYDLQVNGQTALSLTSLLGARIDYFVNKPDLDMRFELDGGWQREYLDHNRSVYYQAVGGPVSSTVAYGSPRNSWLLGLDFLATWKSGIQVESSCDVKWNSAFYDVFFYLGVGKQF